MLIIYCKTSAIIIVMIDNAHPAMQISHCKYSFMIEIQSENIAKYMCSYLRCQFPLLCRFPLNAEEIWSASEFNAVCSLSFSIIFIIMFIFACNTSRILVS